MREHVCKELPVVVFIADIYRNKRSVVNERRKELGGKIKRKVDYYYIYPGVLETIFELSVDN